MIFGLSSNQIGLTEKMYHCVQKPTGKKIANHLIEKTSKQREKYEVATLNLPTKIIYEYTH